jgi:PPE-repeat protein
MVHARWLNSAAAWAERLSVGAEAVAHAFDIAKQDTPTPKEFSDAHSDVMEAAALMAVSPAIGMIEYQQATSRYADLVAKAEEAAKQYHASVGAAVSGVGNPIVPCPPIASKNDIPNIPLPPAHPPARNLSDLFHGRTPKASELEEYALSQGWTKTQTPGGPPKYVVENGIVRMTIKEGSPRTPGSETPHVELRDAT